MDKFDNVKDELSKYNFIRFAICDLNGVSRGHVIPGRHGEKSLKEGIDMLEVMLMLGSETEVISAQDESSYNFGNMNLFPDLDTLRPIPWMDTDKAKFAEVLCESRWKIDSAPQLACPRYVARQQLKKLDDLGFKLFSGCEIELLLHHADTMEPIFPAKTFMNNRQHNKLKNIFSDFDSYLFKSGIDIADFHAEYGPGQMEAVLTPAVGIQAADDVFNLKQGLLEISDDMGLKASFLAKPDVKEVGNSLHFNHSLIANDTCKTCFYDETSKDSLSAIAKHWIAGILKHSRALTVFYAPTPNCYRRLHQIWAPGEISWGLEDREACLRVKNHGPSGTYIENRIPSGNSNPYLVMAATVAAGLDGVINKLECPAPGRLQDFTAEDRFLPKSLSEAMKALEEDTVIVEALGKDCVSWYLKVKEVDAKKFEGLSDAASMKLERKIFF